MPFSLPFNFRCPMKLTVESWLSGERHLGQRTVTDQPNTEWQRKLRLAPLYFFVFMEYCGMSSRSYFGELELLVLAAAYKLGDDAYGVTIRQEISARAGRSVSLGSAYATLGRLAEKKLIRFAISEPEPVRGGRARRYVRLTPAGLRTLQHTVGSLVRMTEGLSLGARA
jgi:DNA-binding PadR family transcriptional regulator